jgi:transposase InsO family protein
MVRELRARGFSASKARIERLMRENGIRGRHKRRYKATTDSKHSLPVAENLLARNFTPSGPNQVWTSDITCPCGPMKAGCIWRSLSMR